MTDMYSSLLSSMWAPEGSEINERLQNLQRLENMRKEREAMLQKSDYSSGRRRNRLETGSGTVTYQSRRARSARGSNEDLSTSDFGGARPKMTSFSNGNQYSFFSDMSRSAIAPRSRLGSTESEGSHFDTSNKYEFSSGSSNFGRSFSKPEGNSDVNIFAGIADSVLNEARKTRGPTNYQNYSYMRDNGRENNGYNSSRRQRRFDRDNIYNSDEPDYGQRYHLEQDQYEEDQDQVNDNQPQSEDGESVNYTEEHYEVHDDPEEEPFHFIERLKQGDQNESSETGYKRTAPHTIGVSPIPSVPPLKRARNSNEDEELGDNTESDEDIVALAKNIHATFGIKSPKTPEAQLKRETFSFSGSQNEQNNIRNGNVVFSAKSSTTTQPKRSPKRKSLNNRKERKSSAGNKNNQGFTGTDDGGEFEVYEIHELQYNSEEDDERVPLEIDTRSSFYQKTAGGRLDIGLSPGKIDNIHEFFSGTNVKEDPEITRELNGSMIKAEMEKESEESPNILANVKSAFNNLVDFSNDTNSSTVKKNREIINKPVRKLKNGNKSSDSDNDSCNASESGKRGSRTSSPSQRKDSKKIAPGSSKASSLSDKRKSPLTIDDKLKKLETLTQAKTRKQSISENDEKRPIPSYMSPTSASQKKTAKVNDSPMTDIVKDVRELKRFVQENVTEPNTPVKTVSTAKEFKSPQKMKNVMQETSTQTDENYENNDVIYICKHCGKSNKDPIDQDTKSLKDHSKTDRQEGSLAESNNDYRVTKHQTEAITSSDKGKINSEKSNRGKNEERQNLKASPNINKTKWESKSEKGFPMHSNLYDKRNTPELKRSNSKESINSMSDGSVLDEKRPTKSKTSAVSRGYMKGTTSSILKNTNGSNNEKKRKASAPDIHRTKGEDTPKFSGKGLVAQRAKGFETFTKTNSQKTKAGLSVYRGKSAERQTETDIRPVSPEGPISPRLAKSKSVDEVHLIKDKMLTAVDDDKSNTSAKTQVVDETEIKPDKSKAQSQVIKKSAPPPVYKKPTRIKAEVTNAEKASEKTDKLEKKQHETEKIEAISTTDTTQTDVKKSKEINENKGNPVTNSDGEILHNENHNDESVDSKGQFLTLEQNPFIKNDVQRKNSFKGHERESVWVKESRSRDSSLKRSNSFETDNQQGESTLQRSNTSVGERSSLTQLSWSDSGSTGSLTSPQSQSGETLMKKSGSHSSLHGSYTDLYKGGTEQQQKVRSGSVSSATSQTSQNSMLNLLNSPSSKRNVVTGALETDVDAAYTEYMKSHDGTQRKVHDEASVERSHLDFAKKACDLLEFEIKTRDSSSDSQNNDSVKAGNVHNGDANERKGDVIATEINSNKNSPKTDENTERQGKKGKRSFLKGKLFKK